MNFHGSGNLQKRFFIAKPKSIFVDFEGFRRAYSFTWAKINKTAGPDLAMEKGDKELCNFLMTIVCTKHPQEPAWIMTAMNFLNGTHEPLKFVTWFGEFDYVTLHRSPLIQVIHTTVEDCFTVDAKKLYKRMSELEVDFFIVYC